MYNGGAGQPYATQATQSGFSIGGNVVTERGPSVIVDATEQVNNAIARVDQVIAQLRNIADAAFGAQPTTAQAGGADKIAPTASRSDELRRATGQLHGIISALEAEANRFGAL